MKKNVFLILFVLLALIVTGSIVLKKSKTSFREKAQIGLPAPDFELQDINGKKWRLRDLKDKIVILNFWASWCSDCKEEKKSIQAYLNKNGNSDDLVFITVLYKDNPITVSEMAKKEGFSFPVLIDDGVISTIYGIKGVPETFLIDKKGVLRHKIVGPVDWSNPHIVPHLKKVLS
ncbi:peroxiredoxin [Thermodesulfovibrio aggregans]|uniref:Peroxiredoxin n=1 Tax=Thermodesulfovibrio aggregans TaxID=86166 RepID=A0A0U9HLX5_9BACT|nr:TlpA disulfide reductase family protein [Thermodesulfovibrio aggregans]GAQ94119.1 peroxiredoxin [Thermodesulfovibrio aggregans]